MKKRRSPSALSALTLTATAVCSVLPIHAAFAQYTSTVIMNGLDNPRGLAFGPNGALYVTEAGRGGNGTTITGGNGSPESFGATGAVSQYLNGIQSRVLTGAPSLAGATGGDATGLQDIVFVGNQAYGIIGLGANPALRSSFTASELNAGNAQYLGHLVTLALNGTNTIANVADIAAYEGTNNPVDTTDSNPFSLIALSGGGFAVTDAGGNTLLGVSAGGVVSPLAALQSPLNNSGFGGPFYQAVPTGITLGPDGSYYFTQLTGYPFTVGAANIYRYNPTTFQTTVAYTGFTTLLDLAFAPDGSLYALQTSTNGVAGNPPFGNDPGPGILYRIDTNGNRTIISQDLKSPTALALGSDGSIYVSNQGSSAGTGQVVRIALAPEPGSLPLLAAGGLLTLVGMGRNGLRRRRAVK